MKPTRKPIPTEESALVGQESVANSQTDLQGHLREATSPGHGAVDLNNMSATELDSRTINEIYPKADAVFRNRLKSIADIKDNCCVVLDTNVLLDPYTTGDRDLLDQCRAIYKELASKNRLIVPAHVAREFARNRAEKLKELHQRLQNKKKLPEFPDFKLGIYPLLNSLTEHARVIKIEEDLHKIRQEYEKNVALYKNAIEALISVVQDWRWNDPVSELYHEVFSANVVIDTRLSEPELRRDLERRKRHKIPPGYKDSNKDDNAEGDLLIWHTILELGKKRETNVLFVSKDVKPDWWHRSGGQPLYPRYELVYEFMNHTSGCSFQILKFSDFLGLFGAIPAVVEKVRVEEVRQEEIERFRRRHRIPVVPREKFLEAFTAFDERHRDTSNFRGWENEKNRRYAIKHGGRIYPVKDIISMATGAPLISFSGGVISANRYMDNLGFDIIRLRGDVHTKGVDH